MKYFRVKKENFLWDEGAILSDNVSCNNHPAYKAIDEIFNKEKTENEVISAIIIENSPEWFERVYPVNLITKTVYKLKEEAKALTVQNYKE